MECAGLSQGTLKLEDLLEIYHLVRAEAMGYEGVKDEKKEAKICMCFVYDGDWGCEGCGYTYEDCNGYDLKDTYSHM